MLIPVRETKDILQAVVTDLAPLTQDAYKQAIREFFEFSVNSQNLSPYADAYQALLAWKGHLGQEYEPATANKKLSAVRRFFDYATANGLITSEQLMVLRMVGNIRSRGDKFQEWASSDEVSNILKSINISTTKGKRDKLLFFLLAGMGLRREETINLKWSQLQRVDGMWLLVDVVGKGRKVRTLHVPDKYISLFEDFRDGARDEDNIIVSVNRGDNKGTSLSKVAVNKIVGQYSNLAPHAFRRFFATESKKQGAPIDVIQRNLGHTTERTTQIYLSKSEITSVYEYGDVLA